MNEPTTDLLVKCSTSVVPQHDYLYAEIYGMEKRKPVNKSFIFLYIYSDKKPN